MSICKFIAYLFARFKYLLYLCNVKLKITAYLTSWLT